MFIEFSYNLISRNFPLRSTGGAEIRGVTVLYVGQWTMDSTWWLGYEVDNRLTVVCFPVEARNIFFSKASR
jgi:hypothetical protein